MEATEANETDREPDETDREPVISVVRATPDRRVFTEDGNTDGWIATDCTVDLEP